jgi:hypothetical protein
MPPEVTAIGALVLMLGGLLVAIRTGTFISSRELDRLVQAKDAEITRLRQDVETWQTAATRNADALGVALDANRLMAIQGDRLLSGQELTERLILAMRERVNP